MFAMRPDGAAFYSGNFTNFQRWGFPYGKKSLSGIFSYGPLLECRPKGHPPFSGISNPPKAEQNYELCN
jgi:hypothetical protein